MKIYLRILKFAKPYKGYVIISLVTAILYVITNGLSLWIIGSLLSAIMSSEPIITNNMSSLTFTDRVNSLIFSYFDSTNHYTQLRFLCITLITTFFFKNIFYYINNISLSYAQNGVILNIRNKIFKATQSFPLSFFKKTKSAEITSRLVHDVNMLRNTFTHTVQNLFNQPLNILFCIITLFLINKELALISLVIIPITGYISIKIGSSIRRKASRSSRAMAVLMDAAFENFSNIRVVKAFTMENQQINKFNTISLSIFKKFFRLDSLRYLSTPTNDMIGAILGAVLLWVGGRQVLIDNTLTGDGFIKFFTFLFAMLQPAKKLSSVNVEINRGIASAKRVFKILDNKNIYKEDNKIIIDSFNKDIVFKNVFFKYNKKQKENILDNINIKIKKGETVAIVGESGSGKTTLVDLIARFFDIEKGDILIDGINYNKINRFSLRKQIGIVSQESILFNDTIYNNIKTGNINASDTDIFKAADDANASNFIDLLSKKYNTKVGEKGTKLSGGQRQRIAIARALIKNPKILILDEATSALDSKSETEIQYAIENITKNRTVIVIAHRLSTILNADKIIVLEKGKIVEEGTHEELLKLDKTYKVLFDMQFR